MKLGPVAITTIVQRVVNTCRREFLQLLKNIDLGAKDKLKFEYELKILNKPDGKLHWAFYDDHGNIELEGRLDL